MESDRIGIIGFGHLGSAIADQLIKNGLELSQLKISCAGSRATLKKIETAGLANCLTSNSEIAIWARTLVLSIRPSQLASLKGLELRKNGLILSAMAGVELDSLSKILSGNLVRIMPSSPMTMELRAGVCAIFPQKMHIEDFILSAGLSPFVLSDEKLFHVFTALVCLPAVYLEMYRLKMPRNDPNSEYGFDRFRELLDWAKRVTPQNLDQVETELFITRMATKGGVTEAMVESFRTFRNISKAMDAGISRSQVIGASNSNS